MGCGMEEGRAGIDPCGQCLTDHWSLRSLPCVGLASPGCADLIRAGVIRLLCLPLANVNLCLMEGPLNNIENDPVAS